MASLETSLNPDKALIFRVIHRDNLPWLFRNGLHCGSSEVKDPSFVSIGNRELIDKRRTREVPIPPGGTLSEYVPFYFTPFTPMLLNIKTGYAAITPRANDEIVVLVTSLRDVHATGTSFVFTDRHAYLKSAQFSSDLDDLSWLPWEALQNRDFKHDPEDPSRFECYQAEALVHRHLPASVIRGVGCYDESVTTALQAEANACGLSLQVVTRPGWYF
jgi:hypothetical protein